MLFSLLTISDEFGDCSNAGMEAIQTKDITLSSLAPNKHDFTGLTTLFKLVTMEDGDNNAVNLPS